MKMTFFLFLILGGLNPSSDFLYLLSRKGAIFCLAFLGSDWRGARSKNTAKDGVLLNKGFFA